MKKRIFFLSVIAILTTISAIAKKTIQVTALRTEYLTSPLGIDNVHPRLSWKIISNDRNINQTAYQIKLAKTEEDLKAGKTLLWDTKQVNSNQSVNVEYKGPQLQSRQRVYWQVKIWDNKGRSSDWSDVSFFEMGLIEVSDWKASWIIADILEDTTKSQPCPMFRKEFNVAKKITHARLYVSSHGLYSLAINGSDISEQVFTPGWTSYNNRLQYQTYDLSSQLNNGRNAISVTLGNGWYRGFLGWTSNRNIYGSRLGLILQLDITYEDNSKEFIVSDETWKASTGAILKSDIYNGELYDARLEKDGWDKAGYNDNNWNKVIIKNYSKEVLVASSSCPVRKIEEIKPKKVFRSPAGETIVDLGQNIVGWIRLDVAGKTGTRITLRYAEVLDKNGNFYTENLRGAKATDEYILKGGKKETFEPHFTFHGFRYIAIDGYPGELTTDNIRGIVIHSDMEPSGNFICSDSLVNQLQHNIVWALKGNFLDVPTDCPQRDERLGWTGDAQVFAPTACFNMNTATFYEKWLKDLKADQFENGSIPWVIPDVLKRGGAAGWADAGIVIPWVVYLTYGDTLILKEQYESMKGWVNYMKNTAGDSCIWKKGSQFGDWLAFSTTHSDYPGATTDKDLVATAYFAHSTNILQKVALILKNKEDAAKYAQLFARIKDAFQKEFITPNGRLASNTQTAYVLSLAFDLLPDSLKQNAADRLANDVKKFKHITTGFLGTPLICEVLTKYGYIDVAYSLLLNKKYPSWLYPITMGATTIWERWDGIKPDSTFQDKDMNSFNHYAYGAIGNWLYTAVAGISRSADAPGYKKIIINPHTGGKLSYAKAEYQSVYGKITSSWQIKDDEFILNVSIPPNTSAEVYIPAKDPDRITENSKAINTVKDIKFVETKSNQSVFLIGSGDYIFKTKMNK
jgi:alpha-L-rhamnosidase